MRHFEELVAFSLALLLAACGPKREGPKAEEKAAAARTNEPAPPVDASALAASMVTIAHADVTEYSSDKPKPTRTKAEALALAKEVVSELRRDPSRFSAIARERSEDPVASDGGDLGTFPSGGDPELEKPLSALAIGAISDPIDSPYGYRILRRDAPLAKTRVAARHLVVAWSGAVRAPASITRTQAEARARAQELAERARRDPASFEALVSAESDGWDKRGGGELGAWTLGSKRWPASFDRAVGSLAEAEIGGPVESAFGYQIFQRIAPAEPPSMLAGAHILISFVGAEKAPAKVRRSKEEALAEASRLSAELGANPTLFGTVAAEKSDDASGKRGGELGSFRRGALPQPVEAALAGLRIGEVSPPVLSPYGYHVLLRREAPLDRDYVVK